MGQSQSTRSHEAGDPVEGSKADYYELLQVDLDASGEEIKKAYRKRALELHPDRNYGNTEEATALFAEVQSAYEVLSDPQERAWYDSHRQVFLGSHGKSEEAGYSYNTRMTTSEDLFQLFTRFSPRMDFSDSADGFYGGLRDTFAQLAAEERAACKWENLDLIDYPTFGYQNDSFEDVVRPFYSVWTGFSTKKSFAWKDVYRYSEAPDRRVRRLMEKENKRLREEGIREFNGAVRSFVAFVRKRDPRYKHNAQSEFQRQETLRQSTAAQAARSRAANSAKLRDHVPQEWSRSEYPNEDHSDMSEEEEEEVEHFECIVCHKSFKSQNQVEAHERSKKHLKAVKQLRWEMKAQNEQLDLEGISCDDHLQSNEAIPSVTTVESQAGTSHTPSDKILDTAVNPTPRHDPGVSFEKDTTVATEPYEKSHPLTTSPGDPTGSGEDDYVPREFIENRLGHPNVSDTGECQSNNTIEMLSQDFLDCKLEDESRLNGKKPGKAKQRRARKAQRPTEGIKCASCDSSFPSRAQLFSHIKELNHAQPQSAVKRPQRGKA